SSGHAADVPVVRELDAEALGRGIVAAPQHRTAKTISVVASGRTQSHTRIVIADPETLVKCGANEVGEIWIAGPSVANGYWQKPAETEAAFHAYFEDSQDGPFLRTGDLGFLSDGQLFVTGRIKDVINIRGFKHYPQDIEHTVSQSPAAILMSGCAAFAVDGDGTEQLAVVIEFLPKLSQDFDDWSDQAITAIQSAVTERHGIRIQSLALAPTDRFRKRRAENFNGNCAAGGSSTVACRRFASGVTTENEHEFRYNRCFRPDRRIPSASCRGDRWSDAIQRQLEHGLIAPRSGFARYASPDRGHRKRIGNRNSKRDLLGRSHHSVACRSFGCLCTGRTARNR